MNCLFLTPNSAMNRSPRASIAENIRSNVTFRSWLRRGNRPEQMPQFLPPDHTLWTATTGARQAALHQLTATLTVEA